MVIAKSDQRTNLNRAGTRVSEQFIFDHGGVFAINHEHAFLDLKSADLIGKYREGIEPERSQMRVALGMDGARILIRGQIVLAPFRKTVSSSFERRT